MLFTNDVSKNCIRSLEEITANTTKYIRQEDGKSSVNSDDDCTGESDVDSEDNQENENEPWK